MAAIARGEDQDADRRPLVSKQREKQRRLADEKLVKNLAKDEAARQAALAAGVPYVPLDEQLAPKVKKGAGIWSRSEAEERSTSPSGTMIHAGSSTTAGSVGEQQQLFTRRERVYSTPPPPTIITGNAPATSRTGNYVPVAVVGTVVKDSGQQQLLSKSRGKIQFVLCGKDSSDPKAVWSFPPRDTVFKVMAAAQNMNSRDDNGANCALLYCSISKTIPFVGFQATLVKQIKIFVGQVSKLRMREDEELKGQIFRLIPVSTSSISMDCRYCFGRRWSMSRWTGCPARSLRKPRL